MRKGWCCESLEMKRSFIHVYDDATWEYIMHINCRENQFLVNVPLLCRMSSPYFRFFFFSCVFQQKRRKKRILPIFIYVGFSTSKMNGKMCARTSSTAEQTIQIVEDPQAKLIESNDTMAAKKQREVNEWLGKGIFFVGLCFFLPLEC